MTDPGTEVKKDSVIFVNVAKVVLIVLGILVFILLAIFLIRYIKEFNFSIFRRRKYMFKDHTKKLSYKIADKIRRRSELRRRRKGYRRRKKF